MEQIHTGHIADLDGLRRLVEATKHLPGDSEIRARVKATWSANGGPITRVWIGDARTRAGRLLNAPQPPKDQFGG